MKVKIMKSIGGSLVSVCGFSFHTQLGHGEHARGRVRRRRGGRFGVAGGPGGRAGLGRVRGAVAGLAPGPLDRLIRAGADDGGRLEQSLTKHASDYLSEEYNAYNA